MHILLVNNIESHAHHTYVYVHKEKINTFNILYSMFQRQHTLVLKIGIVLNSILYINIKYE